MAYEGSAGAGMRLSEVEYGELEREGDESDEVSGDGSDEEFMTPEQALAWARRPGVRALNMLADYAPHWKARDGIRELAQNWWDGMVQVRVAPHLFVHGTGPFRWAMQRGRSD